MTQVRIVSLRESCHGRPRRFPPHIWRGPSSIRMNRRQATLRVPSCLPATYLERYSWRSRTVTWQFPTGAHRWSGVDHSPCFNTAAVCPNLEPIRIKRHDGNSFPPETERRRTPDKHLGCGRIGFCLDRQRHNRLAGKPKAVNAAISHVRLQSREWSPSDSTFDKHSDGTPGRHRQRWRYNSNIRRVGERGSCEGDCPE